MKPLVVKLNTLITLLFIISSSYSIAQCSISSIGDTTICLGNSVDLGARVTVTGTAPIVYDWSPATGLSCTNCPNPIATPLTTTTYTLTITDDDGCIRTRNITVTIAPDPVAGFTFSSNNVCANSPIQFTSTSTGSGLSYAWNFGNPASGGQNTSTQQNRSHRFVTSGGGTANFNVTLTVTNSFGCQDAVTQIISINQTPEAVLVDPITTFKNCDGTNFNLTVYDNSPVTGVSHEIIWGDGSPNFVSAVAPTGGTSHLYTASDIFDMYYIITGANGCADTSHYLVSNITNPAIGAANPGATSGCGPLELCFPLSSYSANHPSTFYIVDYGDSSPNDTLPHPPPAVLCHTYTESSCGQAGNSFTFNIKAINQCDISEASISPIRVYTGPVADFTIPQPNYCVNTAVPFINLSQLGFNSSCATTTLFTWDFGDGSAPLTAFSLTNPTHVYTLPGTYTVTLTATNNCATTTHQEVVCIEQPPVPDFTLSPDTACVPFTAVATNLSSLLSTCNVTRLWNVNFIQTVCTPGGGSFNFTNSTTNTSLNPEILFSTPGEYNVRLSLTNSCGTFFHQQIVLGQAPPQVSIPSFTSICEGEAISPTATINDCYEPSDSYLWTFNGGNPVSSTDLIPGSVSFPSAGNHSIAFQATNACGTTSATAPITIYSPPTAVSGVDTNTCSNIPIGIGAAPVGGVTYSWSPTTGLNNPAIANPTVTISNVSGAPVDYTFVVRASTSINCFTTDTVVVTVYPLPTLVVNSPTICIGDDANLLVTGAGIGGSYVWSPATNLSCTNCDNPTANPIVTTPYTITGTTAEGCVNTTTSTVTVNPLPIVNAGPDVTLCDQPIAETLNGTPVGGTWTGSPNVTAGGIFTPNGTESSQLIYSYTDIATNCSSSDTILVVVNPLIVPTVDPLDSICLSSPSADLNTIFNANPLGGVWTGTGVTNPNFNPATAGVGTHTLTYTLGSSTCQAAVTTDIIVNPEPVLITNNETICFGDDVQLNVSGAGIGGTYDWLPITNLTCSDCDNPIANPTATTIYTITGTTMQGCSASITSTVTVNPLPVVNAGTDLLLCDQPIPVILNGTPVGGTWSGSANVTAGGTFTPNGTEVANLIYAYTDGVTNCFNADTLVVTVNPPITATLDPTDSICINASAINLNTQFNPSTLGGTWSGTGVTHPNFNPATAGIGTHTLTYTLGSGTCQTTSTTDIVVNPQPTIVSANETICFGDDIQLGVSGAGIGGTYDWLPATALSCTNCDNPIANPTATTVYTITGTSSQGCFNTTTSTVTVNPLPVVNAGVDMTLCDQPIPVALNGTPAGGLWTGSPNVTISGTFTPNGTEVANLIYFYTDGITNCSSSDTMVVTVNPPIIATLDPTDSICIYAAAINLNTQFSPSTLGTWTGVGVTNPNFNPATAGVGTHTLTYTLGTGTCQTSSTTEIIVNPQPTIVSSNETICFGGDVQLGVSGAGIGGTYTWAPGTGLSCTNCDNPIANPATTTVYTITGTTMQGCFNSTSSTVTILPLPVVDAGIDTSICNFPVAVQLNGTPSGGVWSGPNITPTGQFTPNGVGNFTVTYTVTLGTGCIDSNDRIVNVLDPTLSDAGADLEACIGSPNVVLNGTPAGGTWSGSFVTAGGIFSPSTAGVYNLIYSTGVGNCLTIDSMEFIVHALPLVDAGTNVGICISEPAFDLVGNPLGGVWSGTGITDVNTGTFDPVVATVGTHTITYTITDPITSCVNTDAVDVTVNPLPVVNFLVDSLICINTPVNFTNTSTLVSSSDWTFGDGGISGINSPSHTYISTGLYDITLIVTTVNGCVDSISKSVSVLDFPNAQYTFTPAIACGPATASFTNTSTGIANTYQWDFGNGTSSALQDPLDVTYSESQFADSIYTIELIATNYCGTDNHIETITIEPTPTAIFGTDFDTGCTPFNVNIANTSIGSADTYYWDFGDGTTSTTSSSLFQHTYYTGSTPTSYTITLVAENNCGSDTTTYVVTATPILVDAFFNTNITSGCAPLTVDFTQYTLGGTQYSWNFDDGNVSTIYSPTHTFTNPGTYNVSLSANDGCGFDTTTVVITVHPEPTIDFTSNPTSVCVNESFNFVNLSSGIAGVTWDFGDGTSSVLVNPTHAYTASGTYNVTLSGTSLTHGCFASVTHQVVVNPTPTAAFTPNPQNGCIPLAVQFANTSANANFYFWDFGDGNTSNVLNPNHTYTQAGTYTIRLIVENTNGCADTTYQNVTAYPLPVVDFAINQPSVCLTTGAVSFTNLSTGAVGYTWNFGNGQSSALTNPAINYTAAGTYTVTLTGVNQYGCSSTSQQVLNFYDYAVASYTLPLSETCLGNELTFNSTSTNATSVEWFFGNAESIIGTTVNYEYPNEGTYTVTMIAYGGGGCNDTLTITPTITINPTPVADFNYENVIEINQWTGLVEFFNLSTQATGYQWYFGDGGSGTTVNPSHSYNTHGNFNVTLIASNSFGCADTIIKPIVVELYKGLYLANAMYPGHSDFNVSHFVPIGVGLKSFELLIFDDWGNLIWSTTALDANGRPTEAWDGTFEGVPVQQDAYVWKVNAVFLDDSLWEGKEYEKNKIKKSGTVTVIR